jgi:hypothetical protein
MSRTVHAFLMLCLFLAGCQPAVVAPTATSSGNSRQSNCSLQAGVPCTDATATPLATDILHPTVTSFPYPIDRVSGEDALKAYQEKTAIFLDIRSEVEFKDSHIPGALNIPLEDLEQRAQELHPQRWIIPYCT